MEDGWLASRRQRVHPGTTSSLAQSSPPVGVLGLLVEGGQGGEHVVPVLHQEDVDLVQDEDLDGGEEVRVSVLVPDDTHD